jgi:hypothetical protein
MSDRNTPAPPRIGVEFGDLLAATVGAVARAQEALDQSTEARARAYRQAPDGELAVPPLWFAFDRVALELEMSATAAGRATGGGGQLFCRIADPTMVGLYGHQASAGVRVRLLMGPRGPLAITDAGAEPADP